MKRGYLFFVIILLIWLFPTNLIGQTLPSPADFSGDENGLVEMLQYLMEASNKERGKFSEFLQPELEDCEAVFQKKFAKHVYRYQVRLDRMADIVVQPLLEDQTEIRIWKADTDDFREFNQAARAFPGGYREIADVMRPEVTFYRFKFVQPGHRLGSAYDVLVYVNGKWCLIHRPWAVMFE